MNILIYYSKINRIMDGILEKEESDRI
ncbi:hypothetical protein LCGC14_3169370, partial [marine sediment metagenome]